MLPQVGTALKEARVMSSARPTSIDIASCAASETIVVTTGSSVYEVIVLEGGCGEVLVRGGQHFANFCSARFVGSMPNGGPIEPYTIDIGLRMEFCLETQVIVTSAVQSLSRRLASAATTDRGATQ
jgi:hypothetical protein